MKEPLSTVETVLVWIWIIATWAVVFWWLGRRNRPDRPTSVPIAFMPIAYCLMLLNPAIDYMLYKMNLRRSKRISAFLKLTDDLRVSKKTVNRRLTRGPGD